MVVAVIKRMMKTHHRLSTVSAMQNMTSRGFMQKQKQATISMNAAHSSNHTKSTIDSASSVPSSAPSSSPSSVPCSVPSSVLSLSEDQRQNHPVIRLLNWRRESVSSLVSLLADVGILEYKLANYHKSIHAYNQAIYLCSHLGQADRQCLSILHGNLATVLMKAIATIQSEGSPLLGHAQPSSDIVASYSSSTHSSSVVEADSHATGQSWLLQMEEAARKSVHYDCNNDSLILLAMVLKLCGKDEECIDVCLRARIERRKGQSDLLEYLMSS